MRFHQMEKEEELEKREIPVEEESGTPATTKLVTPLVNDDQLQHHVPQDVIPKEGEI